MKEITLESKLKLKPGDKIKTSYDNGWIVIKSIIHQDHGIKYDPEDYCYLNGLYYEYEDILDVMFLTEFDKLKDKIIGKEGSLRRRWFDFRVRMTVKWYKLWN